MSCVQLSELFVIGQRSSSFHGKLLHNGLITKDKLAFYLAFLLQASVLSGSLGLGIGAPVVKRWSCLPHSLEEVVSMAAINATGGDPDPDCGEDRGGKRVTAKECECEIQSAVLSLAPLLADG